jgi:hypothetical protein
MTIYKLARVKVKEGVPFGGPVNRDLSHQNGTITYDDKTQLVTVVPNKKIGISKALRIHASNTAFMEELDEEALAASIEKAKEKPPEPVVINIPDDTIVLRSKGK